jgi:hypothetical protein
VTRRLAGAAAAAATLVATTAADGGTGSVTISARPLVMAAPISPQWQPLELSGSVPRGEIGEAVTVQANECAFPGWRDVQTVATGRRGAWNASADVLTKTTFRAQWKGTTSRTVGVETRPGVEIEQLTRSRWSVGLFALRSFLDQHGRLQRFDRRTGRWHTVKVFRLTEKVRRGAVGVWTYARFRARVPRGARVRAYVPRSQVAPCYLAGFSVIVPAR